MEDTWAVLGDRKGGWLHNISQCLFKKILSFLLYSGMRSDTRLLIAHADYY